MAKKRETVDDVLDAIVWMRRKSKKREAVDDFIDALLNMRRNTVKRSKKAKHVPRRPRNAVTSVKVKKLPSKKLPSKSNRSS